jgi:predicted nucleic acid-binding protein
MNGVLLDTVGLLALWNRNDQWHVLIVPTEDDWHDAWAAYRRGGADQPGIVDCVSFVVMRRLQMRQAFTNDNHFRTAGFETLF